MAAATTSLATVYRFDRFMLDVSRRTLLAGHDSVRLPEKAFRVLLVLLNAEGEVVPKSRFLEEVWPDEEVTEANLTQQLFVLRRLIREHGGPASTILTLPRSGYRLGVLVDKKVGLIMKMSCERCYTPLAPDGEAFICSYECTFCSECAQKLSRCCPNCGGELNERPRRS